MLLRFLCYSACAYVTRGRSLLLADNRATTRNAGPRSRVAGACTGRLRGAAVAASCVQMDHRSGAIRTSWRTLDRAGKGWSVWEPCQGFDLGRASGSPLRRLLAVSPCKFSAYNVLLCAYMLRACTEFVYLAIQV